MTEVKGDKDAREIAVIGDSFVDIVASGLDRLPNYGNDSFASKLSIHTGGSAGNTAVHFAALSQTPVTYFCTLGRDQFADLFLQGMARAGVQTVLREVALPTASCIVLSGSGDRCFVNVMGSNTAVSADYFLEPAQFNRLVRAKHVHLGGYFNTLKIQSADLLKLLKRLSDAGCSLSLDAQTDCVGDWLANGNLASVLALVDFFLPSEREACAITRTNSPAEAALALSRGMKPSALAVVKCGEDGALVARAGRLLALQPALACPFVDATGAGDAFNAAFITTLIDAGPSGGAEHGSIRRALQLGCAAGGMRVGLVSASDQCPSAAQIQAFMTQTQARPLSPKKLGLSQTEAESLAAARPVYHRVDIRSRL